jgi:hypothetical protein
MCQRIRGWRHWLVAAACGVFVSATLVLAHAAPVFAATLHGGAHGRTNVLVESGRIVPFGMADIIALVAAAAVACIAVAIDHRLTAREAPPVRHIGRPAAPSDPATSRRRAA